jgi:hypothetical protein
MIETYALWEQENGAGVRFIYRSFRRCLGGAARDLWDQINIIAEEEERDELTFEDHLWELTQELIGYDAYRIQKEYLKRMAKPEGLSVKLWLNRMKNINSYLPLMKRDGAYYVRRRSYFRGCHTEPTFGVDERLQDSQVGSRNKNQRHFGRTLSYRGSGKSEKKNTHCHNDGKNLRNPCRVHNGGHEWDDCQENPKKRKERGRTDNSNGNRDNNSFKLTLTNAFGSLPPWIT